MNELARKRALHPPVGVTAAKRRATSATASLVAATAGLLLIVAPVSASTPIESFSALPSNTQAGGHPDVEVHFTVSNRLDIDSQSACNCEDARNATVHLPTGLIGNVHATPLCSIADFSADECPIDSQIGIAYAETGPESGGVRFATAIYNVEPPPGIAGWLAMKVGFDTPLFTILSARTGSDYGLDAETISIYHGETYPLSLFTEDLWGVPADPSHDPLRINPALNPDRTEIFNSLCNAEGKPSTTDPNSIVKPCGEAGGFPPSASNAPLVPFLQSPTTCDQPLASGLDILSYDGGVTHAEDPWPQMTGCDQLSFNPSLYAQPTTTATDSASGIDVNLSIPQPLSPTLPSPTELQGATITLPPGFSINPNAADGKTACTDSAANFGTENAAECPEFAKVGTLEIDSSALPGPLPGYVYLGQPLPANRYRIFLVADGFGTHVKLAGTVTPDPLTGQLTITFEDLPESPFTAFNMHFFGSERGLLATPTQCGSYPVSTTFTPWDSSVGTQTSTQYFHLDSGPAQAVCPGPERPFNPTFQAGVTDATAGAHSAFSLQLNRSDGDQNLSGLTVSTPPGLSASLTGVPYCPDAALAHAAEPSYSGLVEQEDPSCPAASRIGTSVAGAGAGTHPLYIPGEVYLAGPYKGAPLSLAVITPAVSGPYDLGNVVVRVALHVDSTTAQITAISDPLPQILQGIPLRLREVRINLDRRNFTLNPTNCDQFAVNANLSGDQGAVATRSQPFQVANCSTLPFEPRLSLKISGGTGRTQYPSITANLSNPPGGANISNTSVTLSHSEFVAQNHIKAPCTRAQFAEGPIPGERCPPGSLLGYAKAQTPLFEKPLEGPVYLRANGGPGLPDIVAALRGQVDIDLVGHVDSVHGGLRTTFETVPDAPVSNFTLTLHGGGKGLIVNSVNLCSSPQRASVRMAGQNGKSASAGLTIQVPCGAAAKRRLAGPRGRR